MRRRTACFLIFCLGIPAILSAQRAIKPVSRYFRLICLVHLKGTGHSGDPMAPEYVLEGTAVANDAVAQNRTASPDALVTSTSVRRGILAWRMLPSDDGTMAIIQVVAADHHAFDAILADVRSEVRVFEIGKESPEVIEREMRKYKKDFDLASFRVVVR